MRVAGAAGIAVLISRPTTSVEMETAQGDSPKLITLARISDPLIPEVRITGTNPLAREARLIVLDARQTVSRLSQSLPLPTHYGSPNPPNRPAKETLDADDGA